MNPILSTSIYRKTLITLACLQHMNGSHQKAAMEAHNGSTAVGIFFEKAQPILDGDVTLVTAREVSQKFS